MAQSIDRRKWKLLVIKSLVESCAFSIIEVKLSIGVRAWNELLTEGYRAHPGDPEAGARYMNYRLEELFGHRAAEMKREAPPQAVDGEQL